MIIDTAQREETLARMEEIALRSAYAHGKALTNFSFALPHQNDVITLPNGTLAFRGDTEDSGYTPLEDARYQELFPTDLSFSPALPRSFLHHHEVLVSSHTDDLQEIVRGLIRENVPLRASSLRTFALTSFSAHETLLLALHDIAHLHRADSAAHLVREAYPAFLHAIDSLAMISRRFLHERFAYTLTMGAQDQRRELLLAGLATGYDTPFFTAQLSS